MPDTVHPIGNFLQLIDKGYIAYYQGNSEYKYYKVLKHFWGTDSVSYQYKSHSASNSHDHDSYSTGYKTIYIPYPKGSTISMRTMVIDNWSEFSFLYGTITYFPPV